MTEPQEKPRFVRVTYASEIAAIRRNGLDDPIEGEYGGQRFAYDCSIERDRQRSSAGKEGGQS